jgi:mannose-6-phosphate isomerase-like protein (cupin superfamily)
MVGAMMDEPRAPHYRRANWDELPDNPSFPRPPGYAHPWPTDRSANTTARDLDAVMALEKMSVVFVRLGVGDSITHHRHATAEELHVLIEGSCSMRIGDEVIEARRLDAIVVPPELDRSFMNNSDADAWWIVIGAPIDEFLSSGIAAYLAANGYEPVDGD